MKKQCWRQGDVLFVKVSQPASGKRRVRQQGQILEGEATGHVHRVAAESLAIAEVYEVQDKLFLSASEDGVMIVHEEHAPLVLPSGDYEILRQRQYFPDAIRNVAD